MASSDSLSSEEVASSSSRIGEILEEGTGNGDTLALAAGQARAALADDGGKARRQRLDEIPAASHLGHALDLGVACVGLAVADIVQNRAMQEADVLRHIGDGTLNAVLRDLRDVLTIDPDASGVDVGEALHELENCRFAAARGTDQPGPLIRLEAQAEVLEHGAMAGIGERYLLEDDIMTARLQRGRPDGIAQHVRLQQGGDRLGKPRHVLGDVDQGHRKVSRGMEDREAQGAHEHDVTAARLPALPQHDRPGEHCDRQGGGDDGVKQAHLLEVEQALAPRRHLVPECLFEPDVLPAGSAEGADQRHVADHVGQFAFHLGRLVGEAVMQGRTGGGEPEQEIDHPGGDCRQRGRHRQADRGEVGHREQCGSARRQYIPDE